MNKQMWQRRGYLGAGWAFTAGVHYIRSSTAGDQRHPLQEASCWLLSVKSLCRQPWWCVEISGTISLQLPTTLLLDRSASLNSAVRQKPCEAPPSDLKELALPHFKSLPEQSLWNFQGQRWILGPWLLFPFSCAKWPSDFLCPLSLFHFHLLLSLSISVA